MARFHGSYEDHDSARHLEKADASMIPHHGGAHANMPTELIMRSFGEPPHEYMEDHLDDTIRGIDHQIGVLDGDKRKKHTNPKKI